MTNELNSGVDLEARNRRAAQSLAWNADREDLIALIEVDEDEHRKLAKRTAVDGDWYRISRHTRVRPAYVVQRLIRQRHPLLETRVRDVVDSPDLWEAEIWARRRQTDAGTATG